MPHYRPQLVYSPTPPEHTPPVQILSSVETQGYEIEELGLLVGSGNRRYYDLEAEVSLDMDGTWIRNANAGTPNNGITLSLSGFTSSQLQNTWEVAYEHQTNIMETQHPHETDPYPSTSPTLLSDPLPLDLDFFTPIFSEHEIPQYHHTQHQHPHSQSHHIISPLSNNPSPLHSPPQPSEEEPDLKRLRNTAASARFRAKKKRQEESLQSSAREKREVLQALEGRVSELEVENRWLKDLIFEKGKHQKREGADGSEGRDRCGVEGVDGREEGERKDGVGT